MNTDESATGGSVRSWVFNCIKINIRNVHMLWVFQCRIVCMQAMTTNDSWNNLYRIPERVQIHVKLHTHIVESVVIETSSGGLVQICGTFHRGFTQNSSLFLHEQCTSPSFFCQVWSLMRWFKPLTEELWLPLRCHFFFMCTHAHKSLSNEM